MKIKLLIFLLLAIIAGCNSGKSVDHPSDFYVKYSMKNSLFRIDGNIEIRQGSLYLSYANNQNNMNLNENYTLDESDAAALYKYMQLINFMSIRSPESGMIPDAPYMVIKGSYSDKTNEVSFGGAKTQPEDILKLKSKLFELASKYGSDNWKKNAGF